MTEENIIGKFEIAYFFTTMLIVILCTWIGKYIGFIIGIIITMLLGLMIEKIKKINKNKGGRENEQDIPIT